MNHSQKKKPTKIPCPRCKTLSVYDASNEYRPFCSRSCYNDDLISWANEDYKIAGKKQKSSDPEDEDDGDLDS